MPRRDVLTGMGELLRKARENAGLSTRQVKVVAHSTLTLYELEKKAPGIAVLRRLAAAYGVSIADLVPPVADDPPPAPKPRRK